MSRRPPLAAAAPLLVAAVVAAGYVHTLPFPFQFDDFSSILDNRALDDPLDLGAIWRFRPSRLVTHVSLAWNIAFTGRSTSGLRAVNLLIHVGTSLLVGGIAAELARSLAARRGGRRPSPEAVGLLAALLFAAHPLATQAVTYIIQRTTSLAALLELAAVATYLKARRTASRPFWAASWGLALLAALTKEMAVAVPLLIGVVELALRRSRGERRSLLPLLPYLAVVPVVAITARLPAAELGRAATGLSETPDIARADYAITQLAVVPRYLGLAVWPRGQNLDPDIRVRHAPDPTVLAGAAFLAAASAAALALGRREPLLALGWAWFVAALLPESSLVPIRDVMNEHRAYLPLAGLVWGAAALLARLAAGGGRARLALPALLIVALTAATHARNDVWRDEVRLWSDVARKSPAKARGHNNLGLALEVRGELAAAEAAYRRAIAAEPRYLYARVNLGRICGMAGRHREALAVLEEAAAFAPADVAVLNNLGTTWWALGDTAAAAGAYERAIAAAPGAPEPRANLARLRGQSSPQ